LIGPHLRKLQGGVILGTWDADGDVTRAQPLKGEGGDGTGLEKGFDVRREEMEKRVSLEKTGAEATN